MKETKKDRARNCSADSHTRNSPYDDCKGQCGYATFCSECQRMRKKQHQQEAKAAQCRDEDGTSHK